MLGLEEGFYKRYTPLGWRSFRATGKKETPWSGRDIIYYLDISDYDRRDPQHDYIQIDKGDGIFTTVNVLPITEEEAKRIAIKFNLKRKAKNG